MKTNNIYTFLFAFQTKLLTYRERMHIRKAVKLLRQAEKGKFKHTPISLFVCDVGEELCWIYMNGEDGDIDNYNEVRYRLLGLWISDHFGCFRQ